MIWSAGLGARGVKAAWNICVCSACDDRLNGDSLSHTFIMPNGVAAWLTRTSGLPPVEAVVCAQRGRSSNKSQRKGLRAQDVHVECHLLTNSLFSMILNRLWRPQRVHAKDFRPIATDPPTTGSTAADVLQNLKYLQSELNRWHHSICFAGNHMPTRQLVGGLCLDLAHGRLSVDDSVDIVASTLFDARSRMQSCGKWSRT